MSVVYDGPKGPLHRCGHEGCATLIPLDWDYCRDHPASGEPAQPQAGREAVRDIASPDLPALQTPTLGGVRLAGASVGQWTTVVTRLGPRLAHVELHADGLWTATVYVEPNRTARYTRGEAADRETAIAAAVGLIEGVGEGGS